MEKHTPKLGRPPKDQDASGKPIRVRDYVGVNARMPVELERKLRALAYLSGDTMGELLRKIVETYLDSLPHELKSKIETTAKDAGRVDIWKLADLK